MKSGSEAFQVLQKFLKPTLLILLWMTALRILLYACLYSQQLQIHPDLPAAFFAGFRFDLLVLGFFWIPFVVVVWLSALIKASKKLFLLWKIYFALVVVAIAVLSWLDLFWTASHHARLNSEFFKVGVADTLNWGWFSMGHANAILSTVFVLVSSLSLFSFIGGMKAPSQVPVVSVAKLAGQVVLSLFFVAFAARGTWTPHHLNIEHAQISTDEKINQLPLNAPWNLDK